MITSKDPSNWKHLQEWVAQILMECGWTAELEKSVNTVRGTVELDVYGYEVVDGRRYMIACECKYWKANIPQHVIHSFRTVASDLGVNVGYIIPLPAFKVERFPQSPIQI